MPISSQTLKSAIDEFCAQKSTPCEYAAIRIVNEKKIWRSYHNENPQANSTQLNLGAMAEVAVNGHWAYVGTPDISKQGLKSALEHAKILAQHNASFAIKKFAPHQVRPPTQGYYKTPVQKNFDSMGLAELTALLLQNSKTMNISNQVQSRDALLLMIESEQIYVSSLGADFSQKQNFIGLDFSCTAQNSKESQTRSLNGGLARAYQGGLEYINADELQTRCQQTAEEAIELLSANNCPNEKIDLVLMPDQMHLQIHESIGHPLEYDRILGDERNFAGWSFVKPEDFGQLQYGSALMNVTFDPLDRSQFASYLFDESGLEAQREYLIRDGLLQRGLGSLESQSRLGLAGVANFRASSWNRAPIDRVANINLEPGHSSFNEIIQSVERGVLMSSNRSWSIDDYRRKFQFGCEYAKLIEDGRITKTLKNPNYRSSSLEFWRNLKMLGNASTMAAFGSPYCGKGEPSQVIRYSHKSPICLFSNIEVFGGDA